MKPNIFACLKIIVLSVLALFFCTDSMASSMAGNAKKEKLDEQKMDACQNILAEKLNEEKVVVNRSVVRKKLSVRELSTQKLSEEEVIAHQRDLEEELFKVRQESALLKTQLYLAKLHNRTLLQQKSLEQNILQQEKWESVDVHLRQIIIGLVSKNCYDWRSVQAAFMVQIDKLLKGESADDSTRKRLGFYE